MTASQFHYPPGTAEKIMELLHGIADVDLLVDYLEPIPTWSFAGPPSSTCACWSPPA